MMDPVSTADGHTYERGSIELSLRTSDRSPLTNMPLPSTVLTPNADVKARIAAAGAALRARLAADGQDPDAIVARLRADAASAAAAVAAEDGALDSDDDGSGGGSDSDSDGKSGTDGDDGGGDTGLASWSESVQPEGGSEVGSSRRRAGAREPRTRRTGNMNVPGDHGSVGSASDSDDGKVGEGGYPDGSRASDSEKGADSDSDSDGEDAGSDNANWASRGVSSWSPSVSNVRWRR